MAADSTSHTMMWKILKTAIDQWFVHRSARLGAALAYYSVFSMGPLLLMSSVLQDSFLVRTPSEAI